MFVVNHYINRNLQLATCLVHRMFANPDMLLSQVPITYLMNLSFSNQAAQTNASEVADDGEGVDGDQDDC